MSVSNTGEGARYMSVQQVAVRFGVSKDSIWRWVRQGAFPQGRKLGGRTRRWSVGEIEAYETTIV
ncbi:helix-turn-helix transcriptional regulator [Marivivens aquimaris]|uniref:helix-turn-helix transcriptional regulator n=1 Tax=Marivivens aquimaris TaxID=2774876 RepID=UPI001D1691D8|nr:helix-turn-helix domain-containing protein [Marivivens aquimaris]